MLYIIARVCLIFLQAFLLLIIAFFPMRIRKKILETSQYFFTPIIQRLLFPGSLRESSFDIMTHHQNNMHKHLVMIFSGNNETQEEIYQLFASYKLANGERLSQASCSVLSIPLWPKSSEDSYKHCFEKNISDYLRAQSIEPDQIEHLEILGHSLGGGLALSTAPILEKIFSKADLLIILDRTFTQLSDPAHNLYGFFGDILERTLGLLWQLDNIRTLLALQDKSKIYVRIYQVEPDHILGERGLLSVALRNKVWRVDWQIHHTHSQKDNLHTLPFGDVFPDHADIR